MKERHLALLQEWRRMEEPGTQRVAEAGRAAVAPGTGVAADNGVAGSAGAQTGSQIDA
ncbi:MAG: hypothetical protein ACREKM_08340 [Longimicrobiales bacterium]